MIRLNIVLAGIALSGAAALAVGGQPTLQDKVQTRTSELQSVLQGRSIHLDPAEVNLLMHDSQVRLQLFDVRPEADFNVFHIRDAKRLPLAAMDQLGSHPKFDAKALKVFIAGDEAEAEQAWRYARAAGIANTYVLAGGVNLWLTVFRGHQTHANTAGAGHGLAAGFHAALGDRLPFAFPPVEASEGRAFETKAKRLSKASKPAGGCGG